MTETYETFEDIVEDFNEPDQPAKSTRTVLEVWREVLSNVDAAKREPVTMDQAARLISAHPFLKLDELNAYSVLYYEILEDAAAILDNEIESDPTILDAGDEDGATNKAAYLNLLINWQKMLKVLETSWRCTNHLAGPKMAAFIDGASFLVGEKGLSAHLSQIKFEFNEDDAELVRAAVLDDEEE